MCLYHLLQLDDNKSAASYQQLDESTLSTLIAYVNKKNQLPVQRFDQHGYEQCCQTSTAHLEHHLEYLNASPCLSPCNRSKSLVNIAAFFG